MSALNTGNDHLGECVDNHTCLNNIPVVTLSGIFVLAHFLSAKPPLAGCVNQELVEQAGQFPTNSSL